MAEAASGLQFVLVHGSWHTGAGWRHVSARLTAAGHRVLAPTLAGRGEGARTDIGLMDMVNGLCAEVEAADLKGIVLVGHSAGGTVVAKAAERLAPRLARLVFISPLLAPDGGSILDAVPPDYAGAFRAMAEASGDNTVFPPWPIWRDGFIGDADEALAKTAHDELCPEPFGPVTDKVDLSAFAALEVPKSYINPMEDTVFPIGEWGFFPRMYQRIAPCRLVQLHGSHEVMFSNPAALADALVAAGRP
ncbi:alpha/beta hydrolase [Marinibaculum pumilum]|uniref:Alpha/beta hydrolase n=1 Tax=Marinibaculum pumilum TaxID=1766165 RepID=A0ABV7L235_9PROT